MVHDEKSYVQEKPDSFCSVELPSLSEKTDHKGVIRAWSLVAETDNRGGVLLIMPVRFHQKKNVSSYM